MDTSAPASPPPFWWQALASDLASSSHGAQFLLRAVREGHARLDESVFGIQPLAMVAWAFASHGMPTRPSEDTASARAEVIRAHPSAGPSLHAASTGLYLDDREQLMLAMIAAGADVRSHWSDLVASNWQDSIPPQTAGAAVGQPLPALPSSADASPIAAAFRCGFSVALHAMLAAAPEMSQHLDNLRTRDGRGWLHAAAARRADLVQALLCHGANPNLPSPDGLPPLFLAADAATARALLAAGADPSARTREGVPLLAWWRQNRTGEEAASLASALPASARKRPVDEAILSGGFSGNLATARITGSRTGIELMWAHCILQANDRAMHHRATIPRKTAEQLFAASGPTRSPQESASGLAWSLHQLACLAMDPGRYERLASASATFLALAEAGKGPALSECLPGIPWPSSARRLSEAASPRQAAQALGNAMLEDAMQASPDPAGLAAATRWFVQTVAAHSSPEFGGREKEAAFVASHILAPVPLLANAAALWTELFDTCMTNAATLGMVCKVWTRLVLAIDNPETSPELRHRVLQRFRHHLAGLPPPQRIALLDAFAESHADGSYEANGSRSANVLPDILAVAPLQWNPGDWQAFWEGCDQPARRQALAATPLSERLTGLRAHHAKARLESAPQGHRCRLRP